MPHFPDGPEIALPAGDVTEGVVRIGDTVRRPHQPTSAAVAAYLEHLASVGFAGAPRYLGRDNQGRDVLSFIDGAVPGDPVQPWAAADDLLPSVGQLVRALHEAAAGWEPSIALAWPVAGRPAPPLPEGEPRLVAQRDVTPQNTVFRDGAAVALIDFDLVGWTTRSVDLANAAMHWVPLCDPRDRGPAYRDIDVGVRLRLLLNGYGTDAVSGQQLLDAAALRSGAAYESMRWNAEHLGGGWARMWEAGVGGVIQRRVAWFAAVRHQLAAALAG
ncbi:MAG: phosphotransferase [Actinomycetota bacterium]|nr:phosphotransferase [Actinomycetota bacterium]